VTPPPLVRTLSAAVLAIALIGVSAASCQSSEASRSTKITLGFSAWPGWFPWQVAEEQDMFSRNGINVELRWFDNYTDSLNALSAGSIDANSQTLNDTLASISSGVSQTIVLINDNSTGNDKIIAREGIDSVADLKGKKIAVEQGTVDHYLLLLALSQAGLTQQDIQLYPLSTSAAALAFTSGQVDAVGAFAPFTSVALGRAGSRAIATSAEFPGAIPDHLVVRPELIKEHPKMVQGLVNTWFDTINWIKRNPTEAAKIMAERGGVSVAEYQNYDAGTTIFTRRQNLDAFTPGTTPAHLNYQAIQIADFIVASGIAQRRPSLDGLFDQRFVAGVTS